MINGIIDWREHDPDSRGLPVWQGVRPGISIFLFVLKKLHPGKWGIAVRPWDVPGNHQPLPNSGAMAGMSLRRAIRYCEEHTNEELFALGEEAKVKRGVTR